ncbi:MAG TPA: hypothetical protein ENI17_03040 [Pseudomonas xinjiangensis]|uniref:Uncharacterized protein n=2 Tax=root TaxID=1 RepID=A0A7V1FS58_9GAMM|nr:hypothetical protein [Halopseudomonas xinjiangensis]HEC46585.1 hypothetical protein [Halopseudomonas xinjiangensis]
MPLFEIVFKGQVKEGVALEQARARLGQLFQAGDQQLDVLFSGRRIVIKQGLDDNAAEKYRQAIDRAGAVCLVEPMDDGGASPLEPASPAEPAEAAQLPPSAVATAAPASEQNRLRPRDEYMAAFSDVEAPDFGIAPVGADLQDEYQDFVPLPIDLSALSLAPPGADLDEIKRAGPVSIPNTDHLTLRD